MKVKIWIASADITGMKYWKDDELNEKALEKEVMTEDGLE